MPSRRLGIRWISAVRSPRRCAKPEQRSSLRVAQRAHDEHERERARLADELTEARDRVEAAETALADWREAWSPMTETLGLAADATPAQARAQLAAVDELVAASDNVAKLERRVEALQKDEQGFATDARAFAAELAPDLTAAEPLAIADTLHARAAKARSARAARLQLEPRRRDLMRQAEAADERAAAPASGLTGSPSAPASTRTRWTSSARSSTCAPRWTRNSTASPPRSKPPARREPQISPTSWQT